MTIEHKITMRDGKQKEEYFWLNVTEDHRKILRREEVVAIYEYVQANPDKFNVQS